jgi:RNA polymerase primary sigma factor
MAPTESAATTITDIRRKTGRRFSAEKIGDQIGMRLVPPLGGDEDCTFCDLLADLKAGSAVDPADMLRLKQQTKEALATLTGREEVILRLRYGIGQRIDHTLGEVGQQVALTRERTHELQTEALRKLRSAPPARSRERSI